MYPEHLAAYTKIKFKRHIIPPVFGVLSAFIVLVSANVVVSGTAPTLPDTSAIPIIGNSIRDSETVNDAAIQVLLKISIPNIGVDELPIVEMNIPRDESTIIDQNYFNSGLRQGVVHYPGTSMPGQQGNAVIFGHSSGPFWDTNKYKTAFANLDDAKVDSKIIISDGQEQYLYNIIDEYIVDPDDVWVLNQDTQDKILTLITCTPTGTNLQRLIIKAQLVEFN